MLILILKYAPYIAWCMDVYRIATPDAWGLAMDY